MHLLAPVFAADDDGVAGDLQAGAVGKGDFSVQVVTHRSGGELLPCGGDGLSRDEWCDLGGGCDELRFAHGFGVVGFAAGLTTEDTEDTEDTEWSERGFPGIVGVYSARPGFTQRRLRLRGYLDEPRTGIPCDR